MLTTLGYRIPAHRIDDLLGGATAYPLNSDFANAWNQLPRSRGADGRQRTPAYGQLATGLTAVHGQPVRLFPAWQLAEKERKAGAEGLIVTRGTIDPLNLKTAFRTWEKLIRGGDDRNSLAALLPSPEPDRSFAAYITAADAGTVQAPGWLFDCAQWQLMRKLTERPLVLDRHTELALRLDTDGSVIAWDGLLSNTWNDIVGYAMLRIEARIVTFPGISDLIVVFDAHRSRINHQWRGTKTAWIERDDPNLPILYAPVRHVPPKDDGSGWTTELRDHAATIAEACGLEKLYLDVDLPQQPGRTRPLVPTPRRHPIGKGPGARLMLRLAEHIARSLPGLVPLTFGRDKAARIPEPSQPVLDPASISKTAKRLVVTPAVIKEAAKAAGMSGTRLFCLYATPEARQRMTDQITVLGPAPLKDDKPCEVAPDLTVSFHHVPDLLAHGRRDRQSHLPEQLANAAREKTLSLAWVETMYSATMGAIEDDAKSPLRRLLARHGIASQFLATAPPDATPPRQRRSQRGKPSRDHAAAAALRDLLLRLGGVFHPGIAKEILDGIPLIGETFTLVGIHARRQNSGDRDESRLALTTVALHAGTDPDQPWRAEMYSDRHGWLPYAAGVADFHAGSIGTSEFGRQGEKAVKTRQHMESILAPLAGPPMIIFVDTTATRTIWPGLQNGKFGQGPLPAMTLPATGNIAIVRCNTSREIPRPVDRKGGKQPTDRGTPAAPDRHLYRLTDTDTPVWLLPKSSRVYRAKGGRTGAQYTPWTLPADLKHLLAEDWHSYTGTEIAVVQQGQWTPTDLAAITARLCDHTVAWDDRTVLPIPLHLAVRADSTHPDYRNEDDEAV